MKDLQSALNRLHVEIAECELIARLATDDAKRATFERLIQQYRSVLAELEASIAEKQI